MNAKYLSTEAKKVCKALHFTPTHFEVVNANRPGTASPNDPEYVVIRAWNSKRTVEITNHDIAYALVYL